MAKKEKPSIPRDSLPEPVKYCRSCGDTATPGRDYCNRHGIRSPVPDLIVQFKLLEPDSQPPFRAHASDAGFDLYAHHNCTIKPKETVNVYTGVAVVVPDGWFYSLRGRSSLNKAGIQTLLGTCDAHYSGKLFALLYNGGAEPYDVKKGERVAQIVFERVPHVEMVEVQEFELPPGARGARGFGSSGR